MYLGDVLGVDVEFDGLHTLAQLGELLVEVLYLFLCLVLAYDTYLEVLLYAARLGLCVGVALSLVGDAPLLDVGGFHVGGDGEPALGLCVYLRLQVG